MWGLVLKLQQIGVQVCLRHRCVFCMNMCNKFFKPLAFEWCNIILNVDIYVATILKFRLIEKLRRENVQLIFEFKILLRISQGKIVREIRRESLKDIIINNMYECAEYIDILSRYLGILFEYL